MSVEETGTYSLRRGLRLGITGSGWRRILRVVSVVLVGSHCDGQFCLSSEDEWKMKRIGWGEEVEEVEEERDER